MYVKVQERDKRYIYTGNSPGGGLGLPGDRGVRRMKSRKHPFLGKNIGPEVPTFRKKYPFLGKIRGRNGYFLLFDVILAWNILVLIRKS